MGMKPQNAGKYPGVKVGDILYRYDTEEGMLGSIVTFVDGSGAVVVVDLIEPDKDCSPKAHWITEGWFTTQRQAVFDACSKDVEYFGKRLKYCTSALSAAESGESVDDFLSGYGHSS